MLVAVSVLALGTAGAYLLARNYLLERKRLVSERAEMDRSVAMYCAERIKGRVTETGDSILASIRRIPPDDLIVDLRVMQDTDPLIRNVFVWKRDEGLLWPRPDSATADEENFMRRDADLFTPKAAWGVGVEKFQPQNDAGVEVFQPLL
ncbi:MAG: hypothetical protein FWG05_02255, partial [Kiritimatiellaeota bacterium]|nr:hypothetical protein [Kiritimatiellota bacterium]